MKLLASVLASAVALERGLSPMETIHHAHSRVRNAFRIADLDRIVSENDAMMEEVFNLQGERGASLNVTEFVSRSDALTGSFMRQGECDSSFPTLDGSCNAEGDVGRSMKSYSRLTASNYCNNRDSPRCAKNGSKLPDERKISLKMRQSAGTPQAGPDASVAFTLWGQFITHDIMQTPDAANGEVPCNCKPHNKCHNMVVDNDTDPVMKRIPCMFIVRSSGKVGKGADGAVREQVNQLSSYIDGTTIYGFQNDHLATLMAKDNMHLLMEESSFGEMLPLASKFPEDIASKFETSANLNDKEHPDFVSGDTRVMENSMLSSWHTLFARLHNKAVDGILAADKKAGKNPALVFNQARMFVKAVMNQANYNEHLPLLLGDAYDSLGDKIQPLGRKRKFKLGANANKARAGEHEPPSQNDPSIRNEFCVAAYRFGHAQVPNDLRTGNAALSGSGNSNMPLKDGYFDPDFYLTKGPGACLRGIISQQTNRVNGAYSDATLHNLFKPNNFAHGVDLLAINIGRGREHGVDGYEAMKTFCMSHPDYSKFYGGRQPAMQRGWNDVKALYDDDSDIDLYPGMLFEQHMANAQVGPTAGCVIADQFIGLKNGDRWWYENTGVFTDAQMAEIQRTTLSKTFCVSLEGMGQVSDNVFLGPGRRHNGVRNELRPCSDLGDLDMSAWSKKAMSQKPAKPSSGGSEAQTQDDEVVTVVGCKFSKKQKMLDCSGKGWGDVEMRGLADFAAENKGFPTRGKKNLMMNVPFKKVQRLNFNRNQKISDLSIVKEIMSHLGDSLVEVGMAHTTIPAVTSDFLSGNKNVQHLDLIGTNDGGCLDADLANLLSSNLIKKNKFIFT
jgi:peroxidase